MLQFDEATARFLDNAYLGADVSRRRRASFDAVAPAPGDTILDLGCGNGLLTLELARAVGPSGQVTGLDPSADMLASARTRCSGRDNVDLVEGTAEDLPFPPSQFDKAVSLQVFEYFHDMRPALRELNRVLRPGGRLVIGDMHWDTLAWHSDHPERMARMLRLWDGHLAERCVPAVLPDRLRECGFAVDRVEPVVFCDTVLRADGLAAMMIRLIAAYASRNGDLPPAEAKAWASEQENLAEQGRFFMSITHFVWIAHKA
ncbi:methyltransferase domain-containing protein [Ruegeria sediminis]|uniref:Methyltransferase domain-containing protein n=1 Tax=Ruegeria sediminis TaxID=2583820 RepID=A0ABY2X381_9RHOB|nr:methyltransferase domain-containing protein [Ruegeria sediminis]TMV09548.1 methyltransferase domain-containing protein [Ruegeria sediminis]